MLFLAAVKIATSVRYFLSPFNSEAENLEKTATVCEVEIQIVRYW